MHQLRIVAGVGNALNILATGLPVTLAWACAALSSEANGITITRVTQASQKPDPCVSTEPDQTRSQAGEAETSHCQEFSVQSAEFRSSYLALNNILPSQTCTGIPEIICISFITTPLFLKICHWKYAEVLNTFSWWTIRYTVRTAFCLRFQSNFITFLHQILYKSSPAKMTLLNFGLCYQVLLHISFKSYWVCWKG